MRGGPLAVAVAAAVLLGASPPAAAEGAPRTYVGWRLPEEARLQVRVGLAPESRLEQARYAPAWGAPAGGFGPRGLTDPEPLVEYLLSVPGLDRRLAERVPVLLALPDRPMRVGESATLGKVVVPVLADGEILELTLARREEEDLVLQGSLRRGERVERDTLEITYSPELGLVRRAVLLHRGKALLVETAIRGPGLVRVDPEEDLEGAVAAAIDGGVRGLRAAISGVAPGRGGYWTRYPLGGTSLAMLALLKAGELPDDPLIEQGFDRLRGLPVTEGTYSAALYLMALEARYTPPGEKEIARQGKLFAVPMRVLPPEDMDRALEATAYLLGIPKSRMRRYPTPQKEHFGPVITGTDLRVTSMGDYVVRCEGEGNFLWTYQSGISSARLEEALKDARSWGQGGRGRGGRNRGGGISYDHSNTQYGVLGLISARRCGIRIPDRVWEAMLAWWTQVQVASPAGRGGPVVTGDDAQPGGWSYRAGGQSVRYNMTTAGYVALLAARSGLNRPPPGQLGKMLVEALRRAEAHLDRTTPGFAQRAASDLYGAYGLERAGTFGSRPRFGCDWYQVGAVSLCRAQNDQGMWRGSYDEVIDTSFALLFLARASTPIVITPAARGGEEKPEEPEPPPPDAPHEPPADQQGR